MKWLTQVHQENRPLKWRKIYYILWSLFLHFIFISFMWFRVELMYSCEKSDAVMYQRQIDRVSHSGAVMSHSLSADDTPTHCCCCVEHAALTWEDCNIVVLAATVWVESRCCQLGRVVAVVECQSEERDDCPSPRPTRCHHQPQPSDQATWHQWMIWVDDSWCPLHSPTTHLTVCDIISVPHTSSRHDSHCQPAIYVQKKKFHLNKNK